MRFRHQKGLTIVEVILVIFLFGVLGTGLMSTLIGSVRSSKRGLEHTVATGYIKEGIEAVRSIRDRDWSELVNGTHGLTTAAGYYDFAGTSDSLDSDAYTRTITVEDVYRIGSLSGDIDANGTVFDAASKRVTVNVTWTGAYQQISNLDAVLYVFNWDQEVWVQSLTEEFNAGFQNSTDITSAANGEVTLRAHNTDWEEIGRLYELNLVGGGDRFAMYADGQTDLLVVLGDDEGGDNLHVYDISDVSENTPTLLSSIEIVHANDVAVEDGYAFIAANESGPGSEVLILQLPELTTVGTINLPGSEAANGVDVLNDTLVVVRQEDDEEQEVVFYDVSTPSSPVLLGGADTDEYSLTDVAYTGSYAYVISNDSSREVSVVRQSDFSMIDTIDLSGNAGAGAIDWFGTTVYVGLNTNSSGAELFAINATDPANVSVTSSIEVSASVERIQVDTNGQYAAAATRLDGKNFFVVDLSTFTETYSGDLSGGSQAESGSLFGGHGYLGSTSSSEDVVIFRVSPGGWSDAELVSSADLSGNHDESVLWIDGNYAYLANENNGSNDDFFVYDISTPSSPTYLGSIDTNSDVNDIVVSGNYVYLATKDNSREVVVIDVTTKTSPAEVGSFNAAGSRDARSLALSGTTLYLGRENGSDPELYILNIADPDTPVNLGSVDYSTYLERLAVSGSYLYAATPNDTQELAVFDVSPPGSISQIGSLDLSGSEDAQAIDVSGSMVAIGREDGSGPELSIIDVSNPLSPFLLGSADFSEEISALTLEDTNFVHVAADDWQAQYQRWDITNPAVPTQQASFDLGNDGEAIFFNGVYAYVGTELNDKELQIIGPGSPPTDYVREGNFTSQPFDAGSNTSWDSIEWTLSGTGGIAFRIRTADTQANLATATWVGTGGDPENTFTTSGQVLTTDPNATGRRWLQWKAYLTGSGSSTPVLEDVTIRYSQ